MLIGSKGRPNAPRARLAGAGLAMVLALVGLGARAADTQRACSVDGMSRGGEAQLAVKGQWQPIAKGQVLAPDARLRTGPNTRLHVTCDDGIAVTIGVATEIALTGLVGAAGPDRSIVMHLTAGSTGIVAPRHTWDRFEVATDVAIASVRSTEWLVERDPDGTSSVFTRRGLVAVRAGGTEVAVNAGKGVSVSAGAVMGPVNTWSRAHIAESGRALGFDWK